MQNAVNLQPGKQYIVIKSFKDYDYRIHEPGEIWTYLGTNFLPYDDGLTLHVKVDDQVTVYRLQWRKEEQADLIENFNDFVALP